MFSDCFPCVSCFCGLFQLPCGAVCCVRAEWLTHLSHLPMQMQEAVPSPSVGNMTPSQLQRGHNEHPLAQLFGWAQVPFCSPSLTGPPCITVRIRGKEEAVAVPKCGIAAQLHHVLPHGMAMLPLELAASGDDPHRDGRVPLLCMGSCAGGTPCAGVQWSRQVHLQSMGTVVDVS